MIKHIFAKTIDTSNSPHSGLVAIAVLAGFGLLLGLFFYIQGRQRKAVADVAQKQGWQALPTDDATLGGYVPSYLRNKSNSVGHKYQMAYQAQAEGRNIVLFRYDDIERVINGINNRILTTTDNQTEQQIISYAIAAFTVPQSFGHVLIMHHSKLGNLGQFSQMQKFNLEGDFGKYFDVYGPQGSSVETLSLLTPDVMAYLIDLGQRYHWSIEVNGNLVIVEGDASLVSSGKLADLLSYVSSLRQKLLTKPVV